MDILDVNLYSIYAIERRYDPVSKPPQNMGLQIYDRSVIWPSYHAVDAPVKY